MDVSNLAGKVNSLCKEDEIHKPTTIKQRSNQRFQEIIYGSV